MKIQENKTLSISIAILAGWTGIMIMLYLLTGVQWFQPGDFSFRTAMAYHGLMIPAWLMLILAYLRQTEYPGLFGKLSGTGAVVAGILTGIGALMIHDTGFSFWTVIQVTGMVIAELTALSVLIMSFRYYFATSGVNFNKTAWWTVTTGLIAMSLATPLGHLAGAIKDMGDNFPLLLKHAGLLNMPVEEVVDGYIGSHSHEILGAFLAAAFALPLIRKPQEETGTVSLLEKTGLYIILTATVAQTALYQYCAWFGYEPPDLLASGPNGLPLDDLILIILGVGLLLLIPILLFRNTKDINARYHSKSINRTISFILLAYIISVVALGLYIEFHEQFFGHAEGNAPGVPNDLAYIRAHLLFGFMVVPLLLSTLLNMDLLKNKKQLSLLLGIVIVTITAGLAGTYTWTLLLSPLLIETSVYLTTLFLFVFAFLLMRNLDKN